MTTSSSGTSCPICNLELQEPPRPSEKSFASYFKCYRCGQFQTDDFVLADNHFPNVKHLVSAWIRRQNKAGVKYPIVGGEDYVPNNGWFQSLERMGFPRTEGEKRNALLLAYADIVRDDYGQNVMTNDPYLVSEVASNSLRDVEELNRHLDELGYVKYNGIYVRISGKGWDHIEGLRKSSNSSNSAFIAMWYDPSTEEYRNAAVKAIEYCGYKPIVINQQEFNDFIMDQVVSLIRQSRFLIADFTCREEITDCPGKVKQGVRGGVYWEAGLAYGMGKPVIHTCENTEDSKRRIHFDVEQYKTIFWQQEELTTNIRDLSQAISNASFAEKLALRILSTIGRGTNVQNP